MEKNVLLAISLVASSALAAQTLNNTAANLKPILSNTAANVKSVRLICTTPVSTQPLVLVNGHETDMQSLVLGPDLIERMDVLKDKKSVEKYGDKARGGVIIITTKPGTEFYTVADFVNAEKNLNRSVKQIELNGKLLPDMQKLLIDKRVLSNTMISSDVKIDEKNCEIIFNDTLVITARYFDNKQ